MSRQTIDVLKSFEVINKSIMVREGKLLNTQSLGGNIIAEFSCEEEFPQTFAVYELAQFLNGLSMFENSPSLRFGNPDYVTIFSGNRSAKYFFSDVSFVENSSPPRRVKFPEEDVVMEFKLTQSDLESLFKAAGVYKINDLNVGVVDNEIQITLFDGDNDTNNTYSLVVPGTFSCESSVRFNIKHLIGMKGDYDVSITDGLITRWKHTSIDLVYYIATEDDE